MMSKFLSALAAAMMVAGFGAVAAQGGHAARAAASQESPLDGEVWAVADRAYRAYDDKRYAEAQALVEQAIQERPDVVRLRLLLVHALQQQGKRKEALQAAELAIRQGMDVPALRQARANLRPPAQRPAASRSDAAPRRAAPPSAYQRAYPVAERAYASYRDSDFEAAAKGAEAAFRIDPSQGAWALLWLDALEALEQYDGARHAIQAALDLGAPNRTELEARDLGVRRRQALLETRRIHRIQTEAQEAYARQDYAEAKTLARRAHAAAPDDPSVRRLLIATLSTGGKDDVREAKHWLDVELGEDPDDPDMRMQRGYVLRSLGEPALAAEDFQYARQTGEAPGSVVLDEAYARAASGDNRGAVGNLREAIDEDDAGNLELTPLQRYNIRSSVADLSREWGAMLSLGYRGAQPTFSSLGGAAISTPGDAVFSTAEVYWRPPALNTRWGMLEAYARLSNTLHDSGSRYENRRAFDCNAGEYLDIDGGALSHGRSARGWPSSIGSLGLRYMVANTGFSVGLERRQFLGSATRRGYVYNKHPEDSCDLRSRMSGDLPQLRQELPALADDVRYPDEALRAGIASAPVRYRMNSGAGGWMAYATYGFYQGTLLPGEGDRWLTVSGYLQGGYSWDNNRVQYAADLGRGHGLGGGRLKRQQAFLALDARVGPSFRMPGISERFVLFPHVALSADWIWQKEVARFDRLPVVGRRSVTLSSSGTSWSAGAGPGLAFRYWWGGGHYSAPRSYVDWSIQYRFGLGGAKERAEGLFMSLTISY